VRAHDLFQQGETVVAAVSGGADSTFLLLALTQLAPRFTLHVHAAHVDHGWRGAESAADAAFVHDLAGRLGLPFHGTRLAPSAAGTRRRSPEDEARRARYAFLRDVCREVGARVLATGHTQDDAVETVLLALLRGSGVLGLAGMSWSGSVPVPDSADLRLVRPMLDLRRDEIRAALAAMGQPWREDASNANLALPRNRIRAELVPLLEAMSPGFRPALLRSAALAREAGAFLHAEAARRAAALFRREGASLRAPRAEYLALPPALQGEALRWAVAQLQGSAVDLEWAHVDGARQAIAGGRGGAVAWLRPDVRLRLERGEIVVERSAPPGDSGGRRASR
jgi:tRNA(Ile)-lysidine synthase